jgi:hypothetical protein
MQHAVIFFTGQLAKFFAMLPRGAQFAYSAAAPCNLILRAVREVALAIATQA